MACGESYNEFVDKFKPKKTTDDCYTPAIVYDAFSDWVSKEYRVDKSTFCRPFFPGGDYEHFDYSGKIVVDNPPFSIISKIVKFYQKNNISFILFSPNVSLMDISDYCTALCVGVDITYENGAVVTTSFCTNLDDANVRIRTVPELYAIIKEANDNVVNKNKRHLPKYKYPSSVLTAAQLYTYNKAGIDFRIERDSCVKITRLDMQKDVKKEIYGAGLLLSESLANQNDIARRKMEELNPVYVWELSDREKKLQKSL